MDNAVNARWTGYDVASFREEVGTETNGTLVHPISESKARSIDTESQ
jgi:hypothetical protein